MNPKINTGAKQLFQTTHVFKRKSLSPVSLVQLNTVLTHLHFAWHQPLQAPFWSSQQ